jgi:hypothetical protein
VSTGGEPASTQRFGSRIRPELTWLLASVLLVIPVYVAYLGRNSRPIADDFCTAGWLHQLGFWGSQAYWYQHWSGRFSFSFVMTASQLPGFSLTPWMPALLLALLLAALVWCFGRLTNALGVELGLGGRVLSSSLLLAWTVAVAPDMYQSFLWHTGLVTYTLPLILGAVLAGWLVQQSGPGARPGFWRRAALPFALAFAAGGFSETYVAVQTAAIALALAYWLLAERRRGHLGAAAPIASALLGSLLAAAVIWVAPGNGVRQGLLAAPAPLVQVIRDSFFHAYLFAAQIKNHQLGWLALTLLVALVLGWGGSNRDLGWVNRIVQQPLRAALVLLALPLVSLLLVAAVMAPSAYALRSYPDGRVVMIAGFLVAAQVVLWGLMAGAFARRLVEAAPWLQVVQSVALVLALITAAFLAAAFVQRVAPVAVDAGQFAVRWDGRDRQLRSAAPANGPIAAASLTHMGGLAELARDADFWVNRCVANAYNVGSVHAK